MAQRELDLVLYGATGYVGRQAAVYLAKHAAVAGLRWGIGGRDRGRLESVRGGLVEPLSTPELLVADSRDVSAIDDLVSRTRVVLSTAGPFALWGTPLVDAAVRFGTHYVDISGETVWIRELMDRYHERAAASGTRIIPCAGFDSVPSDIGCYLLASYARCVLGDACREVRGYFRMRGGVNGGTIATYIQLVESGQLEASRDPYLLNPGGVSAGGRRVRAEDPRRSHFDRERQAWVAPSLMGMINTRIVRRSAALAEAWGEPYGPEFHYQEYTRCGPPWARAKAALLSAALGGFERAMQWGPTRRGLQRWLPKPGEGPSERSMAEGWFELELLGWTTDGRRMTAKLADRGDPSNRVTAKCVCESALCLALDGQALPGGVERGGILTPATGLGEALVARLRSAGMQVEVESDGTDRGAGTAGLVHA